MNERERITHEQGLVSTLKDLHDDLDAAVCDAYGWSRNLTDEKILESLITLNHERAEEERRGVIRWLRPIYQHPQGTAQTSLDIETEQATKAEVTGHTKLRFPSNLAEQARAVRNALGAYSGVITPAQLLVIDAELESDIKRVFALALKERFPVYSVIPISDQRFRKENRWDDELSMETNNSSAFNYREKTGGGELSNHAYGRAVDINTFLNPYIKGDLILPHGAAYNPKVAGTFTAESPIVREFLRLGWSWGGNWTSPKDYQHFEKPPIPLLPN